MDYIVSSGQVTPAGLVLQTGDTLTVSSGGQALSVTLNSSSMETISAGGTASGNIVSGGTEFVYPGGTANFTTISAGYQSVYGSATGTVVDGGTLAVSSGGAVTSALVNGGTEAVYKGGSSFATTLSSGDLYISGKEVGATYAGGAAFVFKGGTDSGSTVDAGATLTVSSGGTASGTIANGGSVNAVSSGTLTALTVQSGGTASAYTGATVVGATISAGGSLFSIALTGSTTGGAITGSIGNAGDLVFSLTNATQSATFTGALSGAGILSVLGAGKLVLAGSDTATGVNQINYGAQLELTGAGAAGTGAIDFTTNSGTLIIDGAAPANVISGVTVGSADEIVLAGLAYASGTTSVTQSGDFVTVTTPTGSGTVDIAGSHAFYYTGAVGVGGGVQLTANAPCYLSGTLIATAYGEVPVERIAPGDFVCLHGGGLAVVEWVGHGGSRITEENRSDIAPVIIRRGALGADLPRRDLHLTRRHGVLVGNVLVPVELLVNDRSVVWDEGCDSVTFHHIELAGHGILLAEGAPAESFRDDGSESLFPNASTRRHGKPAVAPCVPVITSGPALERAWRSVAERAGSVPVETVTDDADLHLLQGGDRIAAYAVQDGVHRFRLAAADGDIVLRSRHAIPASFQNGSDERRLGVALLGIELAAAGGRVQHTPHVLRGGVHPAEAPGHRWTKGRATLPAALFEGLAGEIEIGLTVAGTAQYRPSLSS